MPTLSVVLPNFNHATFLPRALEAMLGQSRRPTEIVVVDDGSTDVSWTIIEAYAARHPCIRTVKNERNSGVVAALNRGLELASGDYVHFAAADDEVLPGFYEQSMQLLERHRQAGVCSAIARYVDETGRPLRFDPLPGAVSAVPCYLGPDDVLRLLMSHGPWYTGNTGIWRGDVVRQFGGFRPELHAFTDGFLFQAVARKHGACFVPEVLGDFRVGQGAVSSELSCDVEKYVLRMRCAERLMRTDYRELFPAEYVEYFRRAYRYQAAMIAIRSSAGELRSLLAGNVGGPARWLVLRSAAVARAGTMAMLYMRAHRLSLGQLVGRLAQRLLARYKLRKDRADHTGSAVLAVWETCRRHRQAALDALQEQPGHSATDRAGRLALGMVWTLHMLLTLVCLVPSVLRSAIRKLARAVWWPVRSVAGTSA